MDAVNDVSEWFRGSTFLAPVTGGSMEGSIYRDVRKFSEQRAHSVGSFTAAAAQINCLISHYPRYNTVTLRQQIP